MKRRSWLVLVFVLIFGAGAEALPLKVITWNLHHGRDIDWNNTVDAQAQWLADQWPDIVLLQEVEQFTGYGNFNHVAYIKNVLETRTGRTYYTFWSNKSGAHYGKGAVNAILSVFPLIDEEGRGLPHGMALVMANVKVLPGKVIALLTVHLASWLGNDDKRAIQVAALVYQLTVRGSRVRLSGGDWNATPDSIPLAPMHYWYTDLYKKAKDLGVFSGPDDTRPIYKENSVVGRIDALFLGKRWPSWMTLTSLQHVNTGLSDHYAVVADFDAR